MQPQSHLYISQFNYILHGRLDEGHFAVSSLTIKYTGITIQVCHLISFHHERTVSICMTRTTIWIKHFLPL